MSLLRNQAHQYLTRRARRAPPMADAMLFFGGKFCCGAAKRRHQKDGVVAKAMFAAWSVGNDAFHRSFYRLLPAIWAGQRDDTTKARRALFRIQTGQSMKNNVEALRIRRIISRPAGGVHARLAV